MKTNFTLKQKHNGFIKPVNVEHFSKRDFSKRTLSFIAIMMLFTLMSNPLFAQTNAPTESKVTNQELVVKGIVSDEFGPLPKVNVLLEGTKIGTSTNKKGEFTFPKTLNPGDVLVFSHLSYNSAKVKIIEGTTTIKLVLTSDTIEMIGDLNMEKRFKSKRSN